MSAATDKLVAVAGELHAPRAGVASLDNVIGHQNMQQLIQLRWFAVVGQVATILVVHYGFGIRLPLNHMLQVLTCLALFNMVSLLRWRCWSTWPRSRPSCTSAAAPPTPSSSCICCR
jgi:two-component system sensor histidine kinase RegB